jgi:hypothetical protein
MQQDILFQVLALGYVMVIERKFRGAAKDIDTFAFCKIGESSRLVDRFQYSYQNKRKG